MTAQHRTRRPHRHLSLVVSVAVLLAAALTVLLVVHSYQHHASALATPPPSNTPPPSSPVKSPAAAAVRPTATRKPQVHPTSTASVDSGAHPRQRATDGPHSRATDKTHAATGLPLRAATGNATQVITVVAPSTGSATATVRAWTLKGSKWVAHTPSIAGDVGSDGLSTQPSETRSATPIGSFTLTQAFGADANPGTSLPYLQTDPADWWISQSGPLYNTHQRCTGDCGFTQGAPNEHLYFETPFYNYAVVIDYNTPNTGPVVQGAGSAFFLHVSNGTPTAGCVSIPQADLMSIMRWLDSADHPRILIGVGGTL